MGLCSTAFLILLALKFTEVITMSWWWVFAPLFIVPVFWCVLMPFIFMGIFFYTYFRDYKKNG